MISLQNFTKVLHKDLSSIYVCLGGDLYFNNLVQNHIKKSLFNGQENEFNYSVFSGEACTLDVKQTVESLAFMSEKRLVIFKNLDKMTEKHWEQLKEVLERPCESSILVLFLNKIDKRLKLYKSLVKVADFIDAKPPYDNQMSYWIKNIASSYELTLSSEQIFLIKQALGTNLSQINLELKKLKSFVKEAKTVTDKELADTLSHCHLDNIFNLTKAVANKDCGKSLYLLADLLDLGQSWAGIVALMARHFRLLKEIKELSGQGLSSGQISKAVAVPAFFLQEYILQNNKWTFGQLNQTLKLLYETDKALKTKAHAPHLYLENFIVEVCN